MTAEEVADATRLRLPEINTSTVYRTLELLVSLDLVTETKLGSARSYFEVSPDPGHHHFVCERCGAVGHFGDAFFAPLYEALAARDGFTPTRARATVFGVCRQCRDGAGEPDVAGGSRPSEAGGRQAPARGRRAAPRCTSRTDTSGRRRSPPAGPPARPPGTGPAGRARDTLSEPKAVPMLAASAAFSFLIMMLNVPVLGGTTAHAVGAVLIAVIAGPEIAILAVSAALVIQALLFADGGVLALGVNCFNMAVVMPLVGYAVYRLVAGGSRRSAPRGASSPPALAAYAGIVAAATLAGLELGIQPALHSVNGVAQYAPYGLKVALPAMLASHLLIAGPVEAVFTVGVFAFLARTSPELLRASAGERLRARWLWGVVGVLVLAVPLGLDRHGHGLGRVGGGSSCGRSSATSPRGFARFGDWWKGLLPGYALPGGSGGALAVAVYVLSAVLGVAALAGAAWLIVRLVRRRQPSG